MAAMVAVQHASALGNATEEERSGRARRQAGALAPPLWPGPPGPLSVPFPTSVALYGGKGATTPPSGRCPRDEIEMEAGGCRGLLTRGGCRGDEEVLMNPKTGKGYCAPKLCPPDRVFVYSTQLCHDPAQPGLCPPGRELYVSAFGSPVCQCPDGTLEGDDDLDDDVCDPVLLPSLTCPAGQVFWFRRFELGPECVPDPCDGLNLNRPSESLPFVPSKVNGKCFQMGASTGICPADMYYGLEIDTLKGVCATLEDFGYNIYDAETLKLLLEPASQVSNQILSVSPARNSTVRPQSLTSNSQRIKHTTQPSQMSPPLSNTQSQIDFLQQQIGDLQQQLNFLKSNVTAQSKNHHQGHRRHDNNRVSQTTMRTNPRDEVPAKSGYDNMRPSSSAVVRATLQDKFVDHSYPNSLSFPPKTRMNSELQSTKPLRNLSNNQHRRRQRQPPQTPPQQHTPAEPKLSQFNNIIRPTNADSRRVTPSTQLQIYTDPGSQVNSNIHLYSNSIEQLPSYQPGSHPGSSYQHLPNYSLELHPGAGYYMGGRRRRSPLPHASASTVFETRLLSCRPGSRRDINAKCRRVILPSRLPKRSRRRPTRAPTRPRRSCSGVFDLFRRCVSSAASAASSLNAYALG